MVPAIPRATNGKNRRTLGAIFSAARAARAAIFDKWVVLEGPSLCSISTSGLGIMGV